MRTTQDGIDLIKRNAGFSAVPYMLPNEVWAIGYWAVCDPDGNRITKDTAPIDEATATTWLVNCIANMEPKVEEMINIPLNDNQFSAVMSLVYYIEPLNFRKSNILSALNRREFGRMAFEWCEEWRIRDTSASWHELFGRQYNDLNLFFLRDKQNPIDGFNGPGWLAHIAGLVKGLSIEDIAGLVKGLSIEDIAGLVKGLSIEDIAGLVKGLKG